MICYDFIHVTDLFALIICSVLRVWSCCSRLYSMGEVQFEILSHSLLYLTFFRILLEVKSFVTKTYMVITLQKLSPAEIVNQHKYSLVATVEKFHIKICFKFFLNLQFIQVCHQGSILHNLDLKKKTSTISLLRPQKIQIFYN